MIIRPVLAASTNLEDIYYPGSKMGGSGAQLSTLLNPLIYNLLIISGLIAFFVIIFAGFTYISGSGDKAKMEQAQNMLNYGILGLVVVVTAFLITRVIGAVIGFKFF